MMKNLSFDATRLLQLILIMAFILTFQSCSDKEEFITEEQEDIFLNEEGDIIEGEYIVVFHEDYLTSARSLDKGFEDRDTKREFITEHKRMADQKIASFTRSMQISSESVMDHFDAIIPGFSAKLEDAQVEKLRADSRVRLVEPNRRVQLDPVEVYEGSKDEIAEARTGQTTPCAIANAGGFVNSANSNRWIWIVDSGIQMNHPDLNVVADFSRTFADNTLNDCNGHGTHVAGTAAAINNTFGVVGVSAGAPVVNIKVFGCSGGSSTATILNGINFVAQNDLPGDVMNLSLGGFFGANCANNSSYRAVLQNIGASGTFVAIAAGNSSSAASNFQPACVQGQNLYTVAAMNCDFTFASNYSNFGMNTVRVIATGTNVFSTYLNSGYATLTGTSMATPVIAGILHANNGTIRTNRNVRFRNENYPVGIR
ncbi:MAG: S8 family serine peptidase [Cyclobacteriaceae bacterium]|nr:S8 family serine peptidase [Cyclobacteriaceae bacterium]MCH8515927.1 S8 family serine peptidase [Cyclobacteriaceae bacterium]